MTTQNALFCADYIVIPTLPDFLSTTGLKRLVEFLKILKDQFLLYDPSPARVAGVILNMFDLKKKAMEEIVKVVERDIENGKLTSDVFSKQARVFTSKIRNLSDIARAQDQSKPVCIAFPTSQASQDFVQLTEEIMEVL